MTEEVKEQIQILLYSLVKVRYGIRIKKLMNELPDYSRLGQLLLTDILVVYDSMLERGELIETDGQVLLPNWKDFVPTKKNASKKRIK